MFRLVGSVIEDRWIRFDLARVNGLTSGLIAFWCCGARRETPIDPALLAHCRFFGVRGPRTRDLLKLPGETVLGDPGLALPIIHRAATHPETAGKIICIPHVHDPKPAKDLLTTSGADMIVRPEIEASASALRDVIDRIASARFVLTGSLHGAIVACAYGRPFAFWNSGHIDAPFKWADFAESVGIAAEFVETAAHGRSVYDARIAPNLAIPPLSPILEVCPFEVKPAILLRALAHDGLLDPQVATAAGAALASLEAQVPPDIHTLHAASNIHRRHASRARVQLARRSALLLRDMRRLLPRGLRERLRRAYINGG